MTLLVMVATANMSTAAVVYRDIADVTLTLAPSGLQLHSEPIDMDNNLTVDFTINLTNQPQTHALGTFTGESISIAAGTSNSVLISDATLKYVTAVTAGNAIPSASPIWDNAGGVIAANGSAATPFGPYNFNNAGNFQGGTDKYIAVKFVIGTSTHYGWIRVNVTNSASITIKDLAYEDVADQSILAGQTVSGINKSLEATTIIKNNNNSIEVKFTNVFSGTVEVVSLSGQVVRTENVNAKTCTLNLGDVAKGIYIVVISGKEGYAAKKVAIQ